MFHNYISISVLAIVSVILSGTFSQEIVQFPENATILPGENGTFHCNSDSKTSTTIWRIVSEAGDRQDLDTVRVIGEQSALDTLAGDNIFLYGMMIDDQDSYNSTLIITGAISKNFTRIQCALARAITTGDEIFANSPVAFLRVLGPPTSIANLQASPSGNNVFLSWSPSFSPFSVPATYHVTVQEEETRELLHSSSTSLASFVYAPPDGFCSVLQFSVHASNRAGITDNSILSYTQLTKPNADAVISSLHHDIQLLDGEVTVDIEFNIIPGCIAFPVAQYELLLDEIAPDRRSTSFGPSTLPRFSLNTSHVKENARYSYRVWTINTINLSDKTEPQTFNLTDVQMPTVVVTSTSVMINCSFIPGSLSRGCYLKLVINGILQTRSIERPTGANFVAKFIEITDGIDSQLDLAITVFDWEQDGSISSQPIYVDIIDLRGITMGVPPNTTEGLSTEGFNYLTVTIAVSVSVLAVALLIPIVTACCCIVYKCRHVSQKEQASITDKVLCSTVDFPRPVSGPVPYEVYPAPRRSDGVDIPDRALPREAYSQLDHYCRLNYSMGSLRSGSAIVMNPLSHHPMTMTYPMGMNSLNAPVRRISHDLPYSRSEPRDYSMLENNRTRSSSHSPRPSYHMPPVYSEIDTFQNRGPSPVESTTTTV